jgi:hypothetical protein
MRELRLTKEPTGALLPSKQITSMSTVGPFGTQRGIGPVAARTRAIREVLTFCASAPGPDART